MQSALVSLLTHAVVHNPKSGFDKKGDPVLFYRPGEFPTANDPEFEVPNAARILYKSGELPVVLKSLAPKAHNLGVPFSYTAFVNEHWTTLVGVLGMLALLLPLTRGLPGVYVWMVRRRLVYWYRQLKTLERKLDNGAANSTPPPCKLSSIASTLTCAPSGCRPITPTSFMICADISTWCGSVLP